MVCDYDAQRLENIERNRRVLVELGVVQAASELERQRPKKTSRRTAVFRAPVEPSERRKSSRMEGKPTPKYTDMEWYGEGERKGKRVFDNRIVGHVEEKYTRAHLDLLGSCEQEWVLMRGEGNGVFGSSRVYDRVDGSTCHQCRQKTLGARTSCSDCHSHTGVFCGDCLWMRYGENVEEAAANPKWRCPSCRDPLLCNCSRHRHMRGWGPTGTLYRRAIAQGFKSVAHYLVLNHLEDEASADGSLSAPADGSTTAPSTDATEAVTGGIKAAAGLDQGSTIPAASKNERQAHSAAATQQQKKLLQVCTPQSTLGKGVVKPSKGGGKLSRKVASGAGPGQARKGASKTAAGGTKLPSRSSARRQM